jgi:hypothetical protein
MDNDETDVLNLSTTLRVSTDKQGKSGPGIEAQRAAIARFLETEVLELVAEHVGVESGKGTDARERRPVQREALAQVQPGQGAGMLESERTGIPAEGVNPDNGPKKPLCRKDS